jgi:hypothetical protein
LHSVLCSLLSTLRAHHIYSASYFVFLTNAFCSLLSALCPLPSGCPISPRPTHPLFMHLAFTPSRLQAGVPLCSAFEPSSAALITPPSPVPGTACVPEASKLWLQARRRAARWPILNLY